MKKIIKVMLVGLILMSVLLSVSCPGGGGRAAAPETITFWVYDSSRLDVLNQLAKEFEAEFGIAVEVSMVDLGQMRTQFLLASGGSDCADIAIIPHDNIGPLVENSILLEVNLGNKIGNFLQPAIDGFSYNGRLYGMPLSVENVAFFYNTQLVPTPPATWDEAVDITVRLMREGRVDYMMGLPDATYNVYAVYDSFGGSIFGKRPDGSLDGKQVLLAEPGFVAGLQFLTDMVRRGLIPESIDWDGAHVLFESGRAPFLATGPWALDRTHASGVKYAIGKFPAARAGAPAGNPFLGVQGLIINSTSSRALLAHTFAVDFIAREDIMNRLFRADARPSAWRTVFEAATDPDTRGFNSAGPNAVPMPSIPEMGYVWDAWENAARVAFSGERTPLQALQQAKIQVDNLRN